MSPEVSGRRVRRVVEGRLVGRAYELLEGEVEVSRTQLVEVTVVVSILAELVAAFQRH